jgi:phage protein D
LIRSRGEFRIVLPLSKADWGEFSLLRMQVYQTARKHDQAIIRVRAKTANWGNTLATGTPIKVYWRGENTDAGTFVGYVTHIKPRGKTENHRFEFDIISVAASWDLRKTDSEVWKNKSAPEIVKDIGKKLGYKVVTKQHSLKRPVTAQRAESYWEFMSRLAERIGYALRVDQTTIFFLPLSEYVAAGLSRAEKLNAIPGNPEDPAGNVEEYTAWGGDVSEDPVYSSDTTDVIAIDPVTGKPYEVSSDPQSAVKRNKKTKPRYRRRVSVPAHNRAEAKSIADGAAANGAMAIDTKASCRGSGSLTPYRPVYLELGDAELNGWWIVKSVVHTIDAETSQYMCDVVVSTDSLDPSSVAKPKGRKRRDVNAELRSNLKLTPARSRLVKTNSSPVLGKTSGGKNSSKWVAKV